MIITTSPHLITNVQEVDSILKSYATTVHESKTIATSPSATGKVTNYRTDKATILELDREK